jgi:Glycosyl hydrolase family 115/Gylcosyl hydrolase family 115 C-terminal domain
MLRRYLLLTLLFATSLCRANPAPLTDDAYHPGDFRLAADSTAADIYVDSADAKVAQIAAENFAADVQRVTTIAPRLVHSTRALSENAVLIGTLGESSVLDTLAHQGKIDVSHLAGQWESYEIAVVADPLPNVKSALVIVGSDRRGTAFGTFEVSQQIGVSPWYWWADVAPQHRDNIFIHSGVVSYGPPSVKYRGIFINDEDFGIHPWASKTFDPKYGDIGPKTYAKIFELLLRLKANCLWPAMHGCSKPFNFSPQNKIVADEYAIVMGSSHCEPLLCNNVTEWNLALRGPWSYVSNQKNVDAYWAQRLTDNGKYENLYTIGMRGIHDGPMPDGKTIPEKVAVLQKVINDQRDMLSKLVNPNVESIPQLFCSYKEVLTLYQNGLDVPKDVTLCWADDNHGYIRQLSTPAEQQRPGGSGVYYHVSYWGSPHDYLWVCSTPPALIGEEMTKAYDYGARTLWMLNVGDLKPAEIDIDFFLKLAYDKDSWTPQSTADNLTNWATEQFGSQFAPQIAAILSEYYTLNLARKPEHMGWNVEEKPIAPTELSAIDYGDEQQQRIDNFDRISKQADAIATKLPPDLQDAFYELVTYPVRAATLMNQKILYAQKSLLYASQGRASATIYAQKASQAYTQINDETKYYNTTLANGKWHLMMSAAPHRQAVSNMPPVAQVTPPTAPGLGIAIEGGKDSLPTLSSRTGQKYFIDVFNTGTTSFDWTATADAPWIALSESSGQADHRIWVSVDPKKMSSDATGSITITGAGTQRTVKVALFNPAPEITGFIEDNGVVSMLAEHYTKTIDRNSSAWQPINELGTTANSMAIFPTTVPSIDPADKLAEKSPELDYQMYIYHPHSATVLVRAIPTHRIHPGRGLRYAIAIDDQPPQIVDLETPENSRTWQLNVLRGTAISTTQHDITTVGEHTLKIWMVDPGVVLDKIIVDLGGLRPSYLGPPETICRSN